MPKLKLITVGDNMPNWVETAYTDYAKRLPNEFNLELIEIKAEKRSKNSDLPRLLHKEGEKMLAAISSHDKVIALDEQGKCWNTIQLSEQLQTWHEENLSISFLIGGADGLAPACKQRATFTWSLSALTFPHPMVRIIVAEQIYRAWTILTHHPYHRA